ncbi:MAG: copper oxidase [Acidobacteria bacterium]|nr:copper oxidase [Acidobacteriota bacterium]
MQAPTCSRNITAEVVAFDQVITYNRFGAFNPAGMMYALKRDVVSTDSSAELAAGHVQLRPDKRPRPLVLRMNEGDCLTVTFKNLLTPDRENIDDINFTNQPSKQPYRDVPVKLRPEDSTKTRYASMHVNGLEYVDGIISDGSNVGNNSVNFSGNGLAAPGDTKVYRWYARKQGQYLIHSMGAVAGGEGDGGQIDLGLFGAIVVEPPGAKWYRSQVTNAVLNSVKTGVNPNGTPKINYEATDPSGKPILKMLNSSNEIIYSDVNALITGFTENCAGAPPSGTCGQPFREFVVVFHDEIKTVQAFPELEQDLFHGVRDGFAINYGSGGMGAIVLANRRLVGPSKNCVECKFEEFFLTSWSNGDPAMVIKRDANNAPVEVLFPDDPSNVHHSYLGDPVRFRNLHAGPKETHVFHLHAHQWLHESREDGSTYLDSQTISPGSTFTYEINYGGSGNRNFTPGDAIFHCHLYPHFAQGMWELWRVHDVFEDGTPGMNERACEQQPPQVPCTNPNQNGRNLPDGEIAAGTPNPAIVPLPTKAMPPMPTAAFRGYPFFLAADAGHRPPQPPLDMAPDTVHGGNLDGGLQRHKILSGQVTDGIAAIEQAMLDDPVNQRVRSLNNDPNLVAFARRLDRANIKLLDPNGEAPEQAAMNFHHNPTGALVTTPYGWPARGYASYKPDGTAGQFLVNGRPRIAGAPFAEPCKANLPQRKYRAAYVQIDMVVNRVGWHDRQARITVLEGDVAATRSGARPPEPFFIRANSNDCITYYATNLVPSVLNLDDFQIFTPTDTIGQHIHLVKFDVTSSDGAGNGWNYEDGTFSPDEVRERIKANNLYQQEHGGTQILSTKTQDVFGEGPGGAWVGAQTTIQRWWADPLVNTAGVDRTIQTVFTHDHFSPSSHQHHGMYGALVVEPTDSVWQGLDGTQLGTRTTDGGPTSYAANILFDDPDSLSGDLSASYREFNLAFADFALLYTPAPELKPINPPGRDEVGLPNIVMPPAIPKPESISADDPGSELINYRQEPIPLRVGQSNSSGQFVQKPGAAGDMANVFSTATHGDPFTPLLQAYENDKVKIRLIQGAQEEQHVFTVHGTKWLHENFVPDSGYYNGQAIGISEHFEFVLPPIPPVGNVRGGNPDVADFLYGSGATDNLWNGMWGIMREYRGVRPGLQPLPNNLNGNASSSDPGLRTDFCPSGAPQKHEHIEAWLARDLVGSNGIRYNERFQLRDPAGIVFVRSEDVNAVRTGAKKLEPLVLRANAGDCLNVRLQNFLPETMPDYDAWNFMPMLIPGFNLNQLRPSNQVSLHPQLVEYDVRTSDGANIGINDAQTVAPGQTVFYRWYAGRVDVSPNGARTAQPIEYGVTNLTDYGDIMKHGSHGAIGSLVIEPAGSNWTTPANTYAEADVKNASNVLLFKEFVVNYQDDLNMVGPNDSEGTTILGLTNVNPVRNYVGDSDPEDSGMKAFNYKTEPLWARLGLLQEMTKRNPANNNFQDVPKLVGDKDQQNLFSSVDPNIACGPNGNGLCGDPETPIFSVAAGTRVRFRVNEPIGHSRQHGFTLHGHNWFHEPFVQNSTVLWRPGTDPELKSMTIGTQGGHTARRNWNIILRGAGGGFAKPGDYLYRTQESYQLTNGLWGIFRVTAQ